MFRNYLIITLRNIRRHTGYALLNISGLAIGIASCILISLYILDELRYDRYHENADRIYRIAMVSTMSDRLTEMASTPAPLGPAALEALPEVQQVVRFFPLFQKTLVQYEEKRFYEDHILVAEDTFLDVFSYPLITGDRVTALSDPNTIVMTQELAERYFGMENPIGKTLTIGGKFSYRVSGVVGNVPDQSHFTFDLLIPLSQSTISNYQYENFLREWWDWSCYTYLVIDPNESTERLEENLLDLMEQAMGDQFAAAGIQNQLRLQPITDIHLYSQLEGELRTNSHILYIYVFIAISVLILVISIINFTNLATARAMVRGKEVGVRKSVGADRRQLAVQFISESLCITFVALCLALLTVELVLPTFNLLLDKKLMVAYDNPLHITCLIFFTTGLGCLAGGYPALILSSFNPIAALHGTLRTGGALLRSVLITSQFVISIVLLIATMVVYQQKEYFINQSMGFDKEQMIVIQLHDIGLRWESETIRQELMTLPEVDNVTFSQMIPGLSKVLQGYGLRNTERAVSLNTLLTDYDFIDTYNIPLVAGRNFSRDLQTDRTAAYIINEAVAKQLGWTEPLGKELKWGVSQKWGTVIGVMQDFHFESLHHAIEPIVLHIEPNWYRNISVKVKTQDLRGTIVRLEEVWQKFSTEYPFDYFFLDDRIALLYDREVQLNEITSIFSVLAVFVACLGLFGLVSFIASRRTREIGIRKVLGASTPGIMTRLSGEVLWLVAIANVIAWPVAYLSMERWLQTFAYRTDQSLDSFILAGVLTLLVAWVTVSYQSYRAARTNPVNALREQG